MVFTQIIHSQSGSFHSRAHWQSIKSRNSLCRYKRSDMELGRVVWFICSQNPLENSSDHCEQNLPCKELSPLKNKPFLLPLCDLNTGGGKQSRQGGTVERRILIALITDNMFPDILTSMGAARSARSRMHFSTPHQHATSRHPTVSPKAFQSFHFSPAEPPASHAVTRFSSTIPGLQLLTKTIKNNSSRYVCHGPRTEISSYKRVMRRFPCCNYTFTEQYHLIQEWMSRDGIYYL